MHPLAHSFLNTIRKVTLPQTTPILLAVFWLYTVYHGERTAFRSSIATCDWSEWESWPPDARPHRAVLIADPQLVDPHTYPGRPWPLSTLTERYTDRYMARSYRYINERHDPDSIIFLGDMFDGGREWAPGKAPPLNKLHQWQLEKAAPNTATVPTGTIKVDIKDPGWKRPAEERDLGRKDEAEELIDLTAFAYGENGRWREYDNDLWESEYQRFGSIFLAPRQLYPHAHRSLEPYEVVDQGLATLDNGAKQQSRQRYAVVGTKRRELLASLPGNHDLGFGSGVQMPVRARYKWHFGEVNRLDVLGNHSFVSIDALSLAAWSQFELQNGRETTEKEALKRTHIYAPAQEFIDSLPQLAQTRSRAALANLFRTERSINQAGFSHAVADGGSPKHESPDDLEKRASPANNLPLVLLTHVPLYRAPNTYCGPLRERGRALSITGGYQYQNVLTRTLSDAIVGKLEAAGELRHVFSGDDHDYCNVTHLYSSLEGRGALEVREETIKSFSWAMGVRLPGFQMVSLWNPVDSAGRSLFEGDSVQSHLCLLPDQLAIFIHYATMAALTVLILLSRAVVLALRSPFVDNSVDSESSVSLLRSILPLSQANSMSSKMASKHRHRASSTSLKPLTNSHLGVQRSANARARSVSPGVGLLQSGPSPFSTPTKPLIDQAGYYGPDPSDDEESRIGDMEYMDLDDTQAKWRKRKRSRGRIRRAVDEFVASLSIVAGIAGPFYVILISRG